MRFGTLMALIQMRTGRSSDLHELTHPVSVASETGHLLGDRSLQMTDSDTCAEIIPPRAFTIARFGKSRTRLINSLQQESDAIYELKARFDQILNFLEFQHQHFQKLIARSDDVGSFCTRCQEIIDLDDPERMARERDWLIASYRKRNAHRKGWLTRMGLG